mmetsp:Transcript_59752/g.144347  ORF Transcript_59752/g.144347 Transcript_59752/m.144347 type:complete len:259 (-) Transcript_59752:476-1252(-)
MDPPGGRAQEAVPGAPEGDPGGARHHQAEHADRGAPGPVRRGTPGGQRGLLHPALRALPRPRLRPGRGRGAPPREVRQHDQGHPGAGVGRPDADHERQGERVHGHGGQAPEGAEVRRRPPGPRQGACVGLLRSRGGVHARAPSGRDPLQDPGGHDGGLHALCDPLLHAVFCARLPGHLQLRRPEPGLCGLRRHLLHAVPHDLRRVQPRGRRRGGLRHHLRHLHGVLLLLLLLTAAQLLPGHRHRLVLPRHRQGEGVQR